MIICLEVDLIMAILASVMDTRRNQGGTSFERTGVRHVYLEDIF